jgi:ribosome maturation factor RimP
VSDLNVSTRVREVVEPPLAAEGLELVDVEQAGSVLRVTVDRPGGVDLDAVTDATRLVSGLLDRSDLLGDRTTLEVSSPGVERPLRTPEHYRRFVGTPVTVKTVPGTDGDRRIDGILESADDEGIVVSGRAVQYRQIERARTRFLWPSGPQQARPSRAPRKAASKGGRRP